AGDSGKRALSHREAGLDGLDLVDDGKRAGCRVVADAYHRADFARDRADAARYRRAELGVAELRQDVFAHGLVRLELRFGRLLRREVGVALHDSAGALGQQVAGAHRIALGLLELVLVLAHLRL